MVISSRRLALCKSYLDDCYDRYSGEIGVLDHTIAHYSRADVQANYSVMYFAKSVGCWWGLRDLLDAADDSPVVSIGAGPLFCVMGWFFGQRPIEGQRVIAIDAIDWDGVRGLSSHADLLADIMSDTEVRYFAGGVFPSRGTPQSASAGITKRIQPDKLPEDGTLLLPMVMNHVMGVQSPLERRSEVEEWLREIEKHARRIVLVDMQHDLKTEDFWAAVGQVLGLEGAPRNINFADRSSLFAPCYGDRFLSWKHERERRTGIAARHFCNIAGAVFERGSGWRWIRQT